MKINANYLILIVLMVGLAFWHQQKNRLTPIPQQKNIPEIATPSATATQPASVGNTADTSTTAQNTTTLQPALPSSQESKQPPPLPPHLNSKNPKADLEKWLRRAPNELQEYSQLGKSLANPFSSEEAAKKALKMAKDCLSSKASVDPKTSKELQPHMALAMEQSKANCKLLADQIIRGYPQLK